jgi:Kef-type K+ transport system membrane component KefB
MTELPVLRDLGLILLAAALFAVAAKRIRMPSIAAFLFAGIVLGPVTGLVRVSDSLDVISHAGIALLLFLVGMELSLGKIRDIGRAALLAGLGQILLTGAAAAAVCTLLGFEMREALFLALAVTVSSTVVVVKLLDQRHEMDSLHGRIAVGILLVQDLVVIMVLTLVAGLAGGEDRPLLLGLLRAFASTALLLAAALAAAHWILPRLFAWLSDSLEAMFVLSLSWCFAFALGGEALGLSLEIGAFIAGVSLAQLPYNHELRRRVHPLTSFFVAVFFVTLGVQLDPSAAVEDPLAVIVLAAFVLIGTPMILILILTRLGYGERTAFMGSVTLAQISEFSFVLGTAALGAGLIGERVLSLIGVVGIVTIAASSYLVLNADALLEVVKRRGLLRPFRATDVDDVPAEERSGHVVVIGINALGRRIVQGLAERGEQVLAIDSDPAKLAHVRAHTLVGNVDHLSVVEEARIARAKLVISALRIEDTNRLLAYRCRTLGVPAAIHAFDQAVVRDLEAIGTEYLIASKNEGVRGIAALLAAAGVLD